MRDQFGRKIEYMRISLTDRCNLRCIYCMPEEETEQIDTENVLEYDEIIRVCKIAAKLGISKIKLTGGEPLVRKDIEVLIKRLKNLEGIKQVTLTTNGVLLKEKMQQLYESGLDAVNISLDTLDRKQYAQITKRDQLSKVLEGIECAMQYTGLKVKINCVALAGCNEKQWVPIAEFAKNYSIDVRFIERMPIGTKESFNIALQEEIQKCLDSAFGCSHKEENIQRGNGPAKYWSYPNFQGKIGFISAISHKFCEDCNRIRMTSEGYIKPCLQFSEGIDLRTLLRGDVGDDKIQEALEKVIYQKPRCHIFEQEKKEGHLEKHQMSWIGG